MQMRYNLLIASLVVMMLMTACGGSARTRIGSTDKDNVLPNGQALYQSQGCLGCHTVTDEEVDDVVVGPTMVGMMARAEGILTDPTYTGQATTAEAYIREAILDPNIYITAGYDPVMPATYESILTPAQIEAIVDYIETLPE